MTGTNKEIAPKTRVETTIVGIINKLSLSGSAEPLSLSPKDETWYTDFKESDWG
jgi:hypothetical protein